MKICIDKMSGCCPGVKGAISKAEAILRHDGFLYSLGAIVHNNTELQRLTSQGLKMISHEQFSHLNECSVLIRAHGEPPSTYLTATRHNITIIDCTCPVVLRLQEKIRNEKGTIVIFGKIGHAEVNGLIGQVKGDAFVVQGEDDIDALITSGKLSNSKSIAIFSQTTADKDRYKDICDYLKAFYPSLRIFDTICKQVSSKYAHLKEFAAQHSVILFVSGLDSSNGRNLFGLCHSINPRSYMIETADDIDKSWFSENDSVGICGATSTPRWQLETILENMKNIFGG